MSEKTAGSKKVLEHADASILDAVKRAARQEQFLEVVSAEEARRRFDASIDRSPLAGETVPLAAALGRVLAGDVVAPVDAPPFDRSNVDGFAVRAADLAGAGANAVRRLVLNAEVVACGVQPAVEVLPGTATAIATGGVIPRGADAVVMIEQTELIEEGSAPAIELRRGAASGQFISYAGSDIARGETLLRKGARIGSREIGMLAACGLAAAEVVRRPRVAVLSTGDELVEPGRPLKPAGVYDSNGAILAAAILEAGGEPVPFGAFPDEEVALELAMRTALEACDMVVLSGGTSKGAGDLSHRIVPRLGSPGILVHGVALKPGKPLCLAVIGDKPLVVLPGFPTSAIFTFHAFVAPIIRARAGLPPEAAQTIKARVPIRIASELGREEFVLVSLVDGGDGPIAFPTGKGSGAVTAFSQADGFLSIDALAAALDADSSVDVTLIGEAARAPDLVIMGSHDVALDVVVGALARAQFCGAHDCGRQSRGRRRAQPRRVRLGARSPRRSGDRDLQQAFARPRHGAGAGLAAHAGLRFPPGRRALRWIERRTGVESGARRPGRADGQPQCRVRHPRADRQPARRCAAAGLCKSAALAQRRRRRRRPEPRRLGRRHRAGGAHVRPVVSADRARGIRFPAARRPPRPGRRTGVPGIAPR